MDTSLTASERSGEATSSKTADVAATRIQARARGMIDRKKVKEKRRRYGGKRRPATAAAPAEGCTQAPRAGSAKASLGTGKERALMRGLKSDTGSSLQIPGAGAQAGSTSGAPFQQPLYGDSTDMLNSGQSNVPHTSQPLSNEHKSHESDENNDKMRQSIGMLQSALSDYQSKCEELQQALAQAEAKCKSLEETIPSVQSTQPISHVPLLGSKSLTGNPNTDQQKAAAKQYLDSQQVHKTLNGLVSDLVLTQPPNAIRHMHSMLGAILGADNPAHTYPDCDKDVGKENATPNPASGKTKDGPPEEVAFRMRVFVECTGPGGRGERCSLTRFAKMGKRVLAGEVMVPPVEGWAKEAVKEIEKVFCGSWGVEGGLSPPTNLRITVG